MKRPIQTDYISDNIYDLDNYSKDMAKYATSLEERFLPENRKTDNDILKQISNLTTEQQRLLKEINSLPARHEHFINRHKGLVFQYSNNIRALEWVVMSNHPELIIEL